MNKHIIMLSLLISGCAPLQQAPLIYTSKQVLGIDISAPTTESTGITLNLGFKNVDAAYVPVAVSKKDGRDTGVKMVSATYGKGNGAKIDAPSADIAQKEKIENVKQTLDAREKVAKKVSALNEKFLKYNYSLDSFLMLDSRQKKAALPGLDEQVSEIKAVQALPEEVKSKLDQKEKVSGDEIEEVKKPLNNELADLNSQLSLARDELARSLNVTQSDAMSVFGSFESNVKGEHKDGISQNLGKMFSTGVAAQNLTKGIHAQGILEQCTKLVPLIEDAVQKKAAISMCLSQMATSQ
ncbi:hypothetical protein [Pseudomonas sp. S1Bt23]|uniref:hypothetical protein n=1 Tax=Pseudomonas sp. S1Bt23 TaxID=3095074 RepID=UPI002A5A9CE1|nr:hypothetical protein [Pseudomonas sp. S1Bt23]WPO49057.1 hypothetical protein SHB59_08310 [Pseudomonas sp. S1Bt23]